VLQSENYAKNVRVEGCGIGLRGLFDQRPRLTFRPGVGDRNIEAAKALDGLIDQLADLVVSAQVGTNEVGGCTEFAKVRCKRIPLFLVAARNNDLGIFATEGERRCAAYTREGSGD
jgi:hypothetical protein